MEITNYRQINKGALVAKFDVKIPAWGLTIRECLLFEKEDRKWIGLPSRQYEAKDGSKKSFDYVVFEKDKRARFETACLDNLKAGKFQQAQQKSSDESPF